MYLVMIKRLSKHEFCLILPSEILQKTAYTPVAYQSLQYRNYPSGTSKTDAKQLFNGQLTQ